MGTHQHVQLGFETMEPNESTLNGEGKEIKRGRKRNEAGLDWSVISPTHTGQEEGAKKQLVREEENEVIWC